MGLCEVGSKGAGREPLGLAIRVVGGLCQGGHLRLQPIQLLQAVAEVPLQRRHTSHGNWGPTASCPDLSMERSLHAPTGCGSRDVYATDQRSTASRGGVGSPASAVRAATRASTLSGPPAGDTTIRSCSAPEPIPSGRAGGGREQGR